MTCDCGAKMKCRFTLPIAKDGSELRYRTYVCLNCNETEQTLEVPKNMIMEDWMITALEHGRQSRYLFYKRMKKR